MKKIIFKNLLQNNQFNKEFIAIIAWEFILKLENVSVYLILLVHIYYFKHFI